MRPLLSIALLLSLLFLPPVQGQENGQPLLRSADGIILHFWLPADAVEPLVPQLLKLAAFALDPLDKSPPGKMVDALVIIRKGNWRLTISGSEVEKNDLLEILLVVPVSRTDQPSEKDVLGLLVLEHYSEDKILDLAFSKIGLNSKSLEGSFALTANPSGGLRLKADCKLQDYSPWRIQAQSSETTRYSFPYSKTVFYFIDDDGLKQTFSTSEKNSWFRGRSTVSGFRDNSPIVRFSDWRWADSDTYLILFEDNIYSASSPVK